MSNHLISEAYKRQLGSMARNAVMVLLADKASDDGTGIWASKQRMADELGTTKQTVIATIKSLIADGLIREAGQRKSPNGYTVEYAIVVKALRALPLVKAHCEDQSSTLTGQAALPVKEDDRTGQAALPKPSLTPLSKHTEKRASLIPDDWKPETFGTGSKSAAIVASWDREHLETTVEHFVAHHQAKRTMATDWQPWWKTWVLNSKKFGGSNNGRSHQNLRASNGNSPDRRSSLTRACDESLEWLG